MRAKCRNLTGLGKILCLMLSIVMFIDAMPHYGTLASEGSGNQGEQEEIEAFEVNGEQEEIEAFERNEEQVESEANEGSEEKEETESTEENEVQVETNIVDTNSISGTLWLDANEDGIYDVNEQPLAEYPVFLYLDDNTVNAEQSAITDIDGKYIFENIEPGSYVVGIKAEENGTDYLLPLVGIQNDNKFYFSLDYSKVISNTIYIDTDTVVTGINAAMRTLPEIQPIAGPYDAEINLGDGTYTGNITGITIATGVSGQITFTTGIGTGKNYRLFGTTTRTVYVNSGVTTDITLDGVNTSTSTSPIVLDGTANVNITLSDTNTLVCTTTNNTSIGYLAGIHVAPNAMLKIGGTGSLYAKGGNHSAGIGGSYRTTSSPYTSNGSGTIEINSGTITAESRSHGAGIGGGSNGSCKVNITGGTVKANGGVNYTSNTDGGPGIGPGYGSSGTSTINISGGTVIATGSAGSTGIGGANQSVAGNITISGGRVTATGSNYGDTLDIGYGNNHNSTGSSSIVITGGSVYPTRGVSYVGPAPTNGSANGNDVVTRKTILNSESGKTDGESFAILGIGTTKSYVYRMLIHEDNTAYPWVKDYKLLDVPKATTNEATNITSTGATLNGIYTSNGLSGNVYYQYGITTSYGSTATYNSVYGDDVNASAPTVITGLTPGTAYYFRIVIETDAGTVYGKEIQFTTLIPAVTTTSATNVTSSSAVLNGTYDTRGGTGTVQFEYGTSSGLTTYSTVDEATVSVSSSTNKTYALSGLSENITYYYRIVTIVGGVRYEGNIESFTPTTYIDVTISKTVTGGYADKSKEFTFTLYFRNSTGAPLASGTELTYKGDVIAGSGATPPADDKLILDAEGSDTVMLQHGQTITITGVLSNGKVHVVETTDSNYITSFIDSEDESSTSGNDTDVRNITGVDRTFDFTNARKSVVPSGIAADGGGMGLLVLMALLASVAGIVILVIYRRRRVR